MSSARMAWCSGFAAAVLLGAAGLGAPAWAADDDAALRRQALELNDVTGEKPTQGQIKALVSDPAGTRKLLAVAGRMAKEKEQPFNFNGAYILARAAYDLKDYDASQVFYRVCAAEAHKLRNPRKLTEAYVGLLEMARTLNREKKYPQSAKLSQELLEMLEREGVRDDFKVLVLRQWIAALDGQGKKDQAERMVDTLIRNQPTNFRNYELKAQLKLERKQYGEARKYYQEALERLGNDEELNKEQKADLRAEFQVTLIELLFQDKQYDPCVRQAREFLDTAPKTGIPGQLRPDVLRRLVASLDVEQKYEDAVQAVDSEVKRTGNWRLLQLKALPYRDAGRYAEALRLYQDLLDRTAKDENLSKDDKTRLENLWHYFMSGIYTDMDQIDKAVAQLQVLLAKEPDDATYNNDLGYILADHDRDLDRAEKMIRKALDEDRKKRKERSGLRPEDDKDNAAYLDSLGWVLFKKKQYPEAEKYLRQAVQDEEGRQSIEILDHLGDIEMALGKKQEALATWKKALGVTTESKRDRDRKVQVEKKLKANQ